MLPTTVPFTEHSNHFQSFGGKAQDDGQLPKQYSSEFFVSHLLNTFRLIIIKLSFYLILLFSQRKAKNILAVNLRHVCQPCVSPHITGFDIITILRTLQTH